MSLVLGVMGLPQVEVELLRIIVRLSSNLRSRWTVSESRSCDLLLMDGDFPASEWQSLRARFVVPMVSRGDAAAASGSRALARPIYAEELVELLNQVGPGTSLGDAARAAQRPAGMRASLVRWPSQATLRRHPAFARLAAALARSTQSAESLSVLGRVDVEVCSTFLGLLDGEGALAWAGEAPVPSRAQAGGDAARRKQGLLSRIRQRLGLA
ncbi:hypothetical protein ABL840_37820 [Variovorax sp. NFACC27]|jgi:hypothetical protein|uniref:hypothetical protein n=1 Tax=unclassified Variovorax TaxID=663243 RepID=UPI000898604E|nr:hypothetical protein SAMN03159371_00979 [Variovorax sp. NFACC28]SEG04382.1 hypothetical protein SAMN03159365_01262 [Variovorax sp. NFACC29]SFB99170.1 hypothetical protein SAMN03159379_01261 [Variovorax sp. NFACC26]SFF79432.1 hypothetical protein SAMN03159447_00162 [Variovorax sp. NFACC27]